MESFVQEYVTAKLQEIADVLEALEAQPETAGCQAVKQHLVRRQAQLLSVLATFSTDDISLN
jgi:hypothetical protein